MQRYKRQQIQTAAENKGYRYFTSDNYDINIIGIRNSKTNGEVTNRFDDLVTISYNLTTCQLFLVTH